MAFNWNKLQINSNYAVIDFKLQIVNFYIDYKYFFYIKLVLASYNRHISVYKLVLDNFNLIL